MPPGEIFEDNESQLHLNDPRDYFITIKTTITTILPFLNLNFDLYFTKSELTHNEICI